MGLTEIRTAMKVDLKKPAAEQPGLHVSHLASRTQQAMRLILFRIDGIPMVSQSDLYLQFLIL